jgi:hypothetical protein
MQSLPPLHDENNSIIQNVIPEEMKWKQQLPSHRSFFPKIRLLLIVNWQVFWLTSPFAAFPSRKEQWQRLQKVI